tara:strand:+ start:950 stop:1354 length:405 start_codon:yes stop_codon:yes gene_type:complete
MENTKNKINAHDWIGFGDLEKWYGPVGEEETLKNLVGNTEKKLKEWFTDYDYVQLDDKGNLHRWTDGEDEVFVVGLLDYWMEKVEEKFLAECSPEEFTGHMLGKLAGNREVDPKYFTTAKNSMARFSEPERDEE